MFSFFKGLASALSLLDKLSSWWHDRNIRKDERKKIEREAEDELTKDMANAEHVRADLDSNSDTANRVRDKFTREK